MKTYTEEHVKLLVELAFTKGQEFATQKMLNAANERVVTAIGGTYEDAKPSSISDYTASQTKTGYFAIACM